MARIGLVSDTHGWFHPFLDEAFKDCDRILHAGDIGDQCVLDALEKIAPLTAVKGNIDGGELRFLPLECVEEVEGMRIGVLHIAGQPKSPNATARAFIAREKLDIIVVGHSHITVVGRVGKTLWINPGAAGKSGFHIERTAAILTIEDGQVTQMERVMLGKRTDPV